MLAILAILALGLVGLVVYLQPRTIALIEPGKINAYGVIAGLAPGNEIKVYVQANNPHMESNAIRLVYVRPQEPFELKHDPFGTELNRLVPPVVYEPAPEEAAGWFTITTDDNRAWGIVSMLPYQSKALPFEIKIPEDAKLPKNWYFIIENRNAEESGLVVTRNDCVCLVNMR